MANRINSNNNDADLDDEHIDVDVDSNPVQSPPIDNNVVNTKIISNDVEVVKTVPATTSAIKVAIPNHDQTVEVKQENESISKIINEVASNSKFVPPLPPSLASADSNSQQNQSALGANSFKNI